MLDCRLQGNPDCRLFVFANYPDIGKDKTQADQWEARWLSDTDRKGRANFETVAAGMSAKFPGKPPVRTIPVGEVMDRLHRKMQQGEMAGYEHIADLYEDGVHLKAEGKYLEAVTHYATVFRDDPHDCIITGLRFWKGPYGVDKEFAKVVWDVAWQVVTTYNHTGVEQPHIDSLYRCVGPNVPKCSENLLKDAHFRDSGLFLS